MSFFCYFSVIKFTRLVSTTNLFTSFVFHYILLIFRTQNCASVKSQRALKKPWEEPFPHQEPGSRGQEAKPKQKQRLGVPDLT